MLVRFCSRDEACAHQFCGRSGTCAHQFCGRSGVVAAPVGLLLHFGVRGGKGTFFTCLLRLLAGLLSSGQSSIAKTAPQFRTRTERSPLSVCNLDFRRKKESGLNDLIWSENLQTTEKKCFLKGL